MKISTHTQFKIFDSRFQKYVDESSSMSRNNSTQISKLPSPPPTPDRNISTLPTKLVEGDMPHQSLPHCPQYSAEQTHLISEEVTELLQKGGKRGNSQGFISISFLFPRRTEENGHYSTSKP